MIHSLCIWQCNRLSPISLSSKIDNCLLLIFCTVIGGRVSIFFRISIMAQVADEAALALTNLGPTGLPPFFFSHSCLLTAPGPFPVSETSIYNTVV